MVHKVSQIWKFQCVTSYPSDNRVINWQHLAKMYSISITEKNKRIIYKLWACIGMVYLLDIDSFPFTMPVTCVSFTCHPDTTWQTLGVLSCIFL
jgi:hypothetical protein